MQWANDDDRSPDDLGRGARAESRPPRGFRRINGGTDVMVEINFDRRRPAGLLDLSHVDELATWELLEPGDGGRRSCASGRDVTYTRIVDELADLDPEPRDGVTDRRVAADPHRGTVGGNLGTASPAGDAHPRCSPPGPSSSSRDRPASGSCRSTTTSSARSAACSSLTS